MTSAPLSSCSRAAPTGDDCRCLCGSLLARLVEGAVELKCRRCKRTLRVPLSLTDAPPAASTAIPSGLEGPG